MSRFKQDLHTAVKTASAEYVHNDGDPVTLGSVLQEIPKRVYGHGRIYDVVQACATFSTEDRETVGVNCFQNSIKHDYAAASHMTQQGVVKLSRHDGEVRLAASLYKHQKINNGDEINDLVTSALEARYWLGAHVSSDMKQLNIIVDDASDGDELFEERRQYKIEPIYNVDPDVIQDL